MLYEASRGLKTAIDIRIPKTGSNSDTTVPLIAHILLIGSLLI